MDFKLPFGSWAEAAVLFLLDHAQWLFDGIDAVIGAVADGVQGALTSLPGTALAALIVLVGLWRIGWRFALFALASLLVVVGLGMWPQMVDTLALVLTSTAVALVVGIPLGILAARHDRVQAVLRPALDLMQTMPAFVYLIPAAMLFGLGRVPGTIATIIFSMPPVVRLTSLGIRQVPHELVEAGLAFGCTPTQLLRRVQFPTALPSIMAGINQTIMLSLSMVVIASMIGAGGLGNEVLSGIQRLDIAQGFNGGLAVVILAVLLDRITQSFGSRAGAPTPRPSLSALRARLLPAGAPQPGEAGSVRPEGAQQAG
nr:proline/glycine betaine ABC transporter permease [Azospirillum picis]